MASTAGEGSSVVGRLAPGAANEAAAPSKQSIGTRSRSAERRPCCRLRVCGEKASGANPASSARSALLAWGAHLTHKTPRHALLSLSYESDSWYSFVWCLWLLNVRRRPLRGSPLRGLLFAHDFRFAITSDKKHPMRELPDALLSLQHRRKKEATRRRLSEDDPTGLSVPKPTRV